MPDRAVAAYLRSSALRFEWSCDHQREGKAALRIPTCIADLFSSQPVQNREDVGALPEEQKYVGRMLTSHPDPFSQILERFTVPLIQSVLALTMYCRAFSRKYFIKSVRLDAE